MSDNFYILFWILIGAIIGIIACCLIEWVTENYRPKSKIKAVQPTIEVHGKNYKKQSTPGRVFNKKC